MKKLFLIGLCVLSLIAKESFETNEVKVEGSVLNKLTLNVETLQAMKVVETGSSSLVCKHGGVNQTIKSYEGVRLKDILIKAQIKNEKRGDLNKLYIIARSADGYNALFSYQEIFNTKNGENIIVFYKKNGKLLGSYEGKIGLISMDDTKKTSRQVKWLESISVNRISEAK